MLRNGFIALASLLAVSAMDVSAANAKVNIDINIGVLGGGGGGISCRRGANILANQGYFNIVILECAGRYYQFRARFGGKRFWIKMNSFNGRIVDRRRIF